MNVEWLRVPQKRLFRQRMDDFSSLAFYSFFSPRIEKKDGEKKLKLDLLMLHERQSVSTIKVKLRILYFAFDDKDRLEMTLKIY